MLLSSIVCCANKRLIENGLVVLPRILNRSPTFPKSAAVAMNSIIAPRYDRGDLRCSNKAK